MPDEPVNLGEIERLLNEIAGASVDIQNHLLDLRDHAQEQSKSLIRIAGALEKIAGMNETEIEGHAELDSLSDAELERPAKSNEDIRWSDDP
jgi:methyl-accepting chemotaxis protein